MLVVAEDDLRALDPALLLDEDLLRPVDHDVGDLLVLEEQLERAEAERLVEDLVDEALALGAVEQRVLGVAEMLDHDADLAPERFRVHLVDPVHVEPVDQAHVDVALQRLVLLVRRVGLLGDLARLGHGRRRGGHLHRQLRRRLRCRRGRQGGTSPAGDDDVGRRRWLARPGAAEPGGVRKAADLPQVRVDRTGSVQSLL